MRQLELVGQVYGRLTVTAKLPNNHHKQTVWLCRCECGKAKPVPAAMLRRGLTRSCGCLAVEMGLRGTHGMCLSRTYKSWTSMKRRCDDPANKSWPRYGARGIRVCSEWSDSFEAFYRDMGDRPSGCTLERLDGVKGYQPGNVVWATPKTQARNRRTNRYIEHAGRRLLVTDWAAEAGLFTGVLCSRLKHGWSMDEALSTPSAGRQRPATA